MSGELCQTCGLMIGPYAEEGHFDGDGDYHAECCPRCHPDTWPMDETRVGVKPMFYHYLDPDEPDSEPWWTAVGVGIAMVLSLTIWIAAFMMIARKI